MHFQPIIDVYLTSMPITEQKNTIHQVTAMLAMLATSKNVLFPGHNHLLITGTHDPTL